MVWSTAKGDLELRAEGEEGHGRQRLDKTSAPRCQSLSLRSRDGDPASLPRAHAGRLAVLVSLASNRIQQLAHKSKSADGLLGCFAGRFQGSQIYKSFAKNNRHRLPNVPFRIRIHHRLTLRACAD